MSAHTTRGTRRKASDNAIDISTDHDFVAPYEISNKAFGFLYFLISGYLFDHQSFTSLYNQSVKHKDGWEKIFLNEQDRLKKLKSNENSVVKCFLLNGLLQQYYQDRNGFAQQTKYLHDEIKLRMQSTFPKWESEDLLREIRRWQDIQRRRHLFYFDYEGNGQTQKLPTFLMLQKAMTNRCHFLINYYRQNKNHLNHGENRHLTEFFQHAFIIVAQPTGPDGVPVTDYTKTTFGQSAKLNARIICLLNPDVIRNLVQLSNIDVTLYSLNQDVNDIEYPQAPIVWQTKQVMNSAGESVSILYTEVHNIMVKDSFAKRNGSSENSNLCKLKFRTRVRVIFDLSNKTYPVFEDVIELMSQPFGISCHSQYLPGIVAKVFFYEIEEISRNKQNHIDADILTEYTCRYHKRMLGVETKEHTIRCINEIFSKAFDDVKKGTTTMTLKCLIEKRLAQLISQIKYFVDYPVLAMMYDDCLFLGICNNSKLDGMLMGTLNEPQMLLRFNDLVLHPWQESPEIRCIIHDGTTTKSGFNRKSFVDDMCRFIYESANERAKQTTIFSYSDRRTFYDFQWYNSEAIPILSKIEPPGANDYKPLIPVLWTMMAQLHINGNPQSQSNGSSTEYLHSSNSNSNNDPLAITYTTNQQNLQNKSTTYTFKVPIPVGVNIDPDVIVRYLDEKLRELCEVQNENITETLQTTTCLFDDTIDSDMDQERDPSLYESDDEPNGPLLTPTLPLDPQFYFSNNHI